jgi:hypothetical protein
LLQSFTFTPPFYRSFDHIHHVSSSKPVKTKTIVSTGERCDHSVEIDAPVSLTGLFGSIAFTISLPKQKPTIHNNTRTLPLPPFGKFLIELVRLEFKTLFSSFFLVDATPHSLYLSLTHKLLL